jgi:uncharacterized membrane protein
MKRSQEFVKSTVIGGLLVILPTAIMLFVLNWIFTVISNAINPLTTLLLKKVPMQAFVANCIVIALIIALCFAVGVFVRTRLGIWIYAKIESQILRKAPGYSLVKETLSQFLGNKKQPFSAVALCNVYGNDTLVSAFITDEHDNGSFTVFVPTGPNPTSGNIFHLPGHCVFPVAVPIEDAMRSIISCGAGSDKLITALNSKE